MNSVWSRMRKAADISPADFALDRRWRKRAVAAAAIWFLACLLYGAPAALLQTLARVVVPQLQLHNVSGSFWNGSAAQAFWRQGGRVIALGRFEWHLQAWSLLWLHPSARVATSYGEQFIDTHLRLSPLGTLTLRETSAALPATLLSSWLPIAARGQLAAKFERVELTRSQLRAVQGTLYWQQAQWQWGAHWLALGDYRCELTMPKSQQLHCAVQGQGAFAIAGVIEADTAARQWQAQLQGKAENTLPAEFRQGLQLMLGAQPDAQGKFAVKREGRW